MVCERCKELSLLIVEDEEIVLESLKNVLSRTFKTVYTAEDAEEAMAIYKKHLPDMMICDITIPKGNGFQVIQEAKKINFDATAMIMSAHKELKYFMEAINLGVDAYVLKPVNLDILSKRVNRLAALVARRKKTSAQSQRLIAKYKTALDSSSAVTMVNKKGGITYVNTEMLRVTGKQEEDFIGKRHNLIRHDSDNKILQNIWATVSKGKVWRGKIKDKHIDGHTIHLEVNIVPVLEPTKTVGEYIIISRDITADEEERKQREKRIIMSQAKAMQDSKKKEAELNKRMNELFMEVEEKTESLAEAVKEKEKLHSRTEFLAQKVQELSFMVSFSRIGDSEVSRAKRYNRPLVILAMGIDHFASVVQNLEEDYIVEKMLAAYRRHIADTIRVSDYFVRNEDDNTFTVLLTETDGDGSQGFINRMNSILDKHMKKFHNQIITTSYGVAELNPEEDEFETMVARARDAYRKASSRGRSNVEKA